MSSPASQFFQAFQIGTRFSPPESASSMRSKPTGASAADQGVRPTILGKLYVIASLAILSSLSDRDPLLATRVRLLHEKQADGGVGCGPGGPPHHFGKAICHRQPRNSFKPFSSACDFSLTRSSS